MPVPPPAAATGAGAGTEAGAGAGAGAGSVTGTGAGAGAGADASLDRVRSLARAPLAGPTAGAAAAFSSASQPGGKGKINRLGLNKMLSKMHEDNAAVLLISYTYDNMGSPGKTNAGGNALNFFSSLTYQTARKGWVEKTVKGEKQRIGADVTLKLFKNHINRENPGDKVINLRITNGGIEYMSGKKTDENESD